MASEAPRKNVDIGRVITRGFEALKGNFLPFLGFALLLAGVPAFCQAYLLATNVEQVRVGAIDGLSYVMALFGGIFVTFAGGIVLQGVLTRSTILQLSGRAPDVPGSALLALRLLLPLVGISICVGFMIGVGLICLIVPGIILWCAFSVSVPALVEERGGVFASLGRSRELTRGSRLMIFLLGVLIWVFSLIIGAIFGAIGGAAGLRFGLGPTQLIYAGLSQGLAASLTQVISTVLIAALYVELREVKEGAGAGELAEVFA
jgi:hypothetical protein